MMGMRQASKQPCVGWTWYWEKDMNVKVVLLPDGEDPDSYLQKAGATAFKEYIDKEAKDFILFKTDLLLSEVGNDPRKTGRAGTGTLSRASPGYPIHSSGPSI